MVRSAQQAGRRHGRAGVAGLGLLRIREAARSISHQRRDDWWDANAVVYSSCLSNQTVAHELGHLQGLDHNRENTGQQRLVSVLLWAMQGMRYGRVPGHHVVCVPDGCRAAHPYSRIRHVNYNGYPTGISYEASPSTAAETARTLNDTATTVAGYMASSTSTATAPSRARLAWRSRASLTTASACPGLTTPRTKVVSRSSAHWMA